MEAMETRDRIEKTILLRAPLEKVWSAISDAQKFGTWFGVDFDGAFAPGKKMTGKITPTKVDPEIAKHQEPYKGRKFEVTIERMDAPRHFSFRWHPAAIDEGVDYSKEPTTLVAFDLEPVEGGTRLVVTESGFDKIPLARRAKAFEMNEGGWEAQTKLVEKYLAHGT